MGRFSKTTWKNFMLSLLVGGVSLVAVAYLSLSVTRDLRLLNSAQSDNVQWTLSQLEVEFLEFDSHLAATLHEDDPDLRTLRREFDIFYSRVKTLSESALYEELRDLQGFSGNLNRIQAFLNAALPAIDADDQELSEALRDLRTQSLEARAAVRPLSNSALTYFATDSDRRRDAVAQTLTQLAAAVGFLILLLLLLAIYLANLNAQNVRRRTDIAQASERMKIVTGTSLDAVIVSDNKGRILDFNAAAEAIFGHLAEDVIGADLGALIVPDHHRAAHAAGMARMHAGGEKRVVGKGRVKLEAKRASGEVFPVELAIQSAETDDGEIFIAFLRDISHRAKAEEELVKARDRAVAGEKAKTDFLATMSHEIRTPLNGLLGNLTLLQDTAPSPEQERYIRNMNTSGRLLMKHISDVLDITKYDAGKLELRPVATHLSALIQDIVDSQSGAAEAQNTALAWRWVGEPAHWIITDPDRIQHILINLIGNAVKFTQDGRITVEAQIERLQSDAPQLRLAVRDTGIGIDPDLQERIFDDFVTGDTSYDRAVGGTGLGLGIARRFAEALGGKLGVESAKGSGSHFWVRVPVTIIADPSVPADRTVAAPTPAGCTILLVEDNEINRFVAREMLQRAGHRVTEAENGRAGVDAATAERFDLIFMDISMPVMDGRSATRAIRRGTGPSSSVPIIALTANAMASEKANFLSDGMNDVITKPLTREALGKVIAQWAGKDRAPLAAVQRENLADLLATIGSAGLSKLLDRFSAEVEDYIAWVSDATELCEDEVAKRAHKIAGSAASLGATDLRGTLLAIEDAARAGDRVHLSTACNALPQVWRETQGQLTSRLSR